MSASKERKQELELERQRQREEEARTERRSMRIYAAVGVLCAVIGLAVLVMNTGILQRSMTAVSVNGTDFTAADIEYYYNMEYQNVAYTAQTYAMYGLDYGFDYTKSPAEQVFDEETGETWEDYLMTVAKEAAVYYTAMADAATAAGHTLSAEAQETLDSVLTNIETSWVGSYPSRNAYLRATYGSYMTYDRFVELLEREVLAGDYINATTATFEYSDADYDAYYTENADTLDTFTLTQFVFRASVPTAAEGEEELSEEEQAAALEQAKAEQKALAEELKGRLEAGEDAEALAEEYADELYSSAISSLRLGSTVSTSIYGEWALESGRQEGDITLAEYDSTTAYHYYVMRYEGRELDKSNTADVRHILVAAEMDDGASQPTDAQFDAAKTKAEDLLAQWKSGEATEESFAMLAVTHSADTGSAAEGGLITSVSNSSGYIAEFTDWCLDDSRQVGDTGIVKNTGSSIMGWHVMYYVNDGMPVWQLTADGALRDAEYAEWETGILEGYEAVEGFGMKFL